MPASRKDKAVCSHCRATVLARDMSRHGKQHVPNRHSLEFVCTMCGKRALQRTNLLDHFVRRHTSDSPHICGFLGEPACTLAFSSTSERSKHRTEVHGRDKKFAAQKGAFEPYVDYVVTAQQYGKMETGSPSSSSTSFSAASSPVSTTSSSRRPTPSSRTAPVAVPAGVMPPSMMSNSSLDPLAQLVAMHPGDYSHLPAQMPVDISSFNNTHAPVSHPAAWSQQRGYGGQNTRGMQQAFNYSVPQGWTHAQQASRFGRSAQQW
ncbi:hypothetical protein C8T65DRAFT_667536 [Cerioporus squamosus]|nr:hypothetical protein C8T65DRAFT_667536 [Cerioporus squamosus]